MSKIKVAVFASGGGTNVEEFLKYFQNHNQIDIHCICSNNPTAYALTRATNWGKEILTFNRDEFFNNEKVIKYLDSNSIDFIVLAGFMWLLPPSLIKEFPERIINIHPALLPKYGGKGMYGDHVHNAVIAAGEQESGITIHSVNEAYDEGKILFQASTNIDTNDDAESLANKIHSLEYKHYPQVAEQAILSKGKRQN